LEPWAHIMARLHITGGRPLSGTIKAVGNKNAALPMLAASLLTDEKITLHNVPVIRDVAVMLELLESLGVSVERDGNTVVLQAKNITGGVPDSELSRRVRGSILLAGPLLSRAGSIQLAPPGGDVIGRRRLDTHFQGLQALGAKVTVAPGKYTLAAKTLHGADMLLDEASVTATENIVMAAVGAEGETTMYNTACEPHVQNLCRMLVAMGAHIEGIGTNFLRIHGVPKLSGCEVEVDPDFMEVGSYLAAAAATGGELTIEARLRPATQQVMRRGFKKLGVEWQAEGGQLVLSAKQALTIEDDLGGAVPKIEDGIWPAFPSDLMSVAIVLATQAQGGILFFEKMFESRMYFVDRLIEMGARIVQCDPHRVMVMGPSPLRGCHLTSPDIRAGMALVIAALAAEGESVIDNAQMIDRGYERIDERLRSLGAEVRREA